MIRSALAVASALLLAQAASTQRPPAAANEAPIVVRVRGTLLDDRLQPAADVPILHLLGTSPDVREALKQPLATTGGDGAFDVRVPLDPDTADALLFGGKRFAVRRLALTESARDVWLGSMAMTRGFTAIGRVRTADGAPLANARVVGTDLLDTRPFLAQSRYRQTTQYRTSTAVSPRGIFQLPGMLRSAGELVVECDGYFDARVLPVAMGTPLDVTLHRAPTITGRVVDGNGAPLADMPVYVGRAHTRTDAKGAWSLQPRDRAADVARTWSYRGGTYTHANVPLPDDGGECTLTLDVPAGAAASVERVRVRAATAEGASVETFTAYASWTQESRLQQTSDAQLLAAAAASASHHADAEDGEAVLPGPRHEYEDTLVVYVRAPGHALARVPVSRADIGDEPIQVELEPANTIAGRLVDKDSGEPIAGADVVVTPKLDDRVKHWLGMGFYDVADLVGPLSCTTDADGRWRADALAKGEVDVLVVIGGVSAHAVERYEVKGGAADAELQDLEFEVAPLATLRGTLEGELPKGLEIRPHWHRENMSSSAWVTEYDGAVAVAADGTFVLPDLGPVTWRPEVLLPTPPRGGLRGKLHCKLWDAAAPPKEPWKDALPQILEVTGRVGGEVPWHRLGVLASLPGTRGFPSTFAPQSIVAAVEPDRTFRLHLPAEKQRLILFDVFTGVAFGWKEIEAADLGRAIELPGNAVVFSLRLGTDAAGTVRTCTMQYQPETEHWPLADARIIQQQPHSGMQTELVSDQETKVWLPAHSGTLLFTRGESTLTHEVTPQRAGLEVVLQKASVSAKAP